MASVISIVSGKGGTGKTVVAANIAFCFSAVQQKTLIIDCDTGLRNADIVLGYTNLALYNIGDVVSGECSADKAIVTGDGEYQPDFLASTVTVAPQYVAENLKKVLQVVSNDYDYVILDAPSGVGVGFEACVAVANIVVAVTNEDYLSVRNASLCVSKIREKFTDKDIRLVINRVTCDETEDAMTVEDIIDEVGCPLCGIIPEDKNTGNCIGSGKLVAQLDTPAAYAFKNIAERLNGKRVQLARLSNKKSLFSGKKLLLRK